MQNRNSILTFAFVIFSNVFSFACIKPVAIGNDLTTSTLPPTSISAPKKPSFVQKILLKYLVRKMGKKLKKEVVSDPNETKKPSNSLALWSLTLGLLGVGILGIFGFTVGFTVFLSFMCGFFAAGVGIKSIGKINKHPEIYTGKGLAVTGVILGIGLILLIIFGVLLMSLLNSIFR